MLLDKPKRCTYHVNTTLQSEKTAMYSRRWKIHRNPLWFGALCAPPSKERRLCIAADERYIETLTSSELCVHLRVKTTIEMLNAID